MRQTTSIPPKHILPTQSIIPRSTVCFLFLIGLLASPAPPNSEERAAASPDLSTTPKVEEIVLIEEIAAWLEPTTDEISWRRRVHEQRASFEVFRAYHGQGRRHQALAGVEWGRMIRQAAEKHRVDGLLLAAMVEVESGFDPFAVSSQGAVGLLQIMPAMVAPEDRPRLVDPQFNLDRGAAYLRRLIERYDGDLPLALAAYNAGPTNVRRYGGIPPFRETRRHVERVLEIYVASLREVWEDSEAADQLAQL